MQQPVDSPRFELRSERPEDASALRELHLAAFGDANVACLPDRIRASGRSRPELSVVAEDGAGVAGHVMLSYADLVADGRTRQALLLSPLGVRPDAQRRGVGGALVREAIARADALGEPLIFLEGNSRYYTRFGFRRADALGFEPPRPDIPPPAFMVRPLAAYRPAWRGRLVYPAAFDVL